MTESLRKEILFHPNHWETVEKKAEKYGMTTSEYVRFMAINGRINGMVGPDDGTLEMRIRRLRRDTEVYNLPEKEFARRKAVLISEHEGKLENRP